MNAVACANYIATVMHALVLSSRYTENTVTMCGSAWRVTIANYIAITINMQNRPVRCIGKSPNKRRCFKVLIIDIAIAIYI